MTTNVKWEILEDYYADFLSNGEGKDSKCWTTERLCVPGGWLVSRKSLSSPYNASITYVPDPYYDWKML